MGPDSCPDGPDPVSERDATCVRVYLRALLQHGPCLVLTSAVTALLLLPGCSM